ncbi:MAG: serine protease [Candidatus Dormibacter sp.]
MQPFKRLPLEQLALAAVGALVLTSLVVLAPAVASRLTSPKATPTPGPTAEPTAPPAAVLLPEELERDLQGVMILANDQTFGTAFLIDPRGTFITAASLVNGAPALRLIDNTGGSHAVRVIGIDAAIGLAEVQADTDGLPLAFGMSGTVMVSDPLVLLASPKVANLRSATPAVVTEAGPRTFTIRSDDLPGEIGGPLVGPSGTVLGVVTQHGSALPIAAAQGDLAAWRGRAGTPVPLAALPLDLVLRGTDGTSVPSAGVSLLSVAPTRASTTQTTLLTLQGSGFVAGPNLVVRFVPVASPSGTFQGLNATVVNASVITVKVPAGTTVQDYVVEVTNGDGAATTFHTAFTVTP